MRPGELGLYDPSFVARHAPWLTRLVHGWFRADVRGLERLPDGPFVGAGNHSGGVMIPDTLVWLGAYYGSGRATPLLTLAHDGMFDAYPAGLALALSRMGALRARRELALEALGAGYAVQVYPGGDHDACRSFSRRNRIVFAGRTGYVELAREAGVPIVPVVSIGGHETLVIVWDGSALAARLPFARRQRLAALPLSLSVPWGLWLGPLPGFVPLPAKIAVRVLDPIDPREGSVEAIDRRVRERMQAELDALARGRLPWIG